MSIDSQPNTLLLLSGGLDSSALAALLRPQHALYLDYGQRPADTEQRAAERIATEYGIRLHVATLGIRDFGSGILHDDADAVKDAPSPEWWPYRNQFLATAASALALKIGSEGIALGTVRGDGDRHLDGTEEFYRLLDALVAYQEGGIRISAPAINYTTEELLVAAGLGANIIAETASCHRSNFPCGACPGCWKRQRVLASMNLPGYSWNS
ncbi:7-cyano-7-deazaguanine synthase [Curtobacterium sp. RRHDQ66]|uniref:7-cyano-7-deazaguanine synthase n=1 Tax=Curtobacterium guangdongense TaxID=3413380 RepID=UPI003BF3C0A0